MLFYRALRLRVVFSGAVSWGRSDNKSRVGDGSGVGAGTAVQLAQLVVFEPRTRLLPGSCNAGVHQRHARVLVHGGPRVHEHEPADSWVMFREAGWPPWGVQVCP